MEKEIQEKLNKTINSKFDSLTENSKNKRLYSNQYYMERIIPIDLELKHYENYLNILHSIDTHVHNLLVNSNFNLIAEIQALINLLIELTDLTPDQGQMEHLLKISSKLLRYKKYCKDPIQIEFDEKAYAKFEYYLTLNQFYFIEKTENLLE